MVVKNGRLNAANLLFSLNSNVVAGTVDIQGGTLVIGTNINISNNAATPANKNHLLLGNSNPLVPTELVVTRITQSGAGQDVQFNGGTLTVGSIGFATPGTGIFNGGTLSPGNFTVAGGGSGFGTTLFTANNNSNFVQGVNHHIHLDLGDNGLANPTTANRDYIQLNLATGTVQLNGTIDVDFIGTTPVVGAVYDVLKVAIADGITDASTLISHTPGINFTKYLVTTTNNNDTLRLEITSVPEPTMLGILGVGVIAALYRDPRRPKRHHPQRDSAAA